MLAAIPSIHTCFGQGNAILGGPQAAVAVHGGVRRYRPAVQWRMRQAHGSHRSGYYWKHQRGTQRDLLTGQKLGEHRITRATRAKWRGGGRW